MTELKPGTTMWRIAELEKDRGHLVERLDAAEQRIKALEDRLAGDPPGYDASARCDHERGWWPCGANPAACTEGTPESDPFDWPDEDGPDERIFVVEIDPGG